MSRLLALPDELMLMIASYLYHDGIAPLLRVNKRLHALISPEFYKHDVEYHGLGYFFSVASGQFNHAAKMLKFGQPVDSVYCLHAILKQPMNHDFLEDHKLTMLQTMAMFDQREQVKWLLANGADPEFDKENRFDAIALACFKGHEKIAVDMCNSLDHLPLKLPDSATGATLFHLAAEIGLPKVVAHFVERGIDVDMVGVDGKTALDIASANAARTFGYHCLEEEEDVVIARYQKIVKILEDAKEKAN